MSLVFPSSFNFRISLKVPSHGPPPLQEPLLPTSRGRPGQPLSRQRLPCHCRGADAAGAASVDDAGERSGPGGAEGEDGALAARGVWGGPWEAGAVVLHIGADGN